MAYTNIQAKINSTLSDIKDDNEVLSTFLQEIIRLELAKGDSWQWKKEYRKLINKAEKTENKNKS